MHKVLKGITPPEDDTILMRYMNFEKFANILATNSLFFTRADKFDDPFEGFTPPFITDIVKNKVSHLKYGPDWHQTLLKLFESWRKYVMCSCWYQGRNESLPMWERYHMRESGIAIKTTMGNFNNSLGDDLDVFIGNIQYIDYKDYRDPQSFVDMNIAMVYTWYFYKRKAFVHEREFRAIIDASPFVTNQLIPQLLPQGHSDDVRTLLNNEFPDVCEAGMSLKIDVNTLICELIISPYADKWIVRTIKSIVEQYGFQFPVKQSQLLKPPHE